MKIFNIFLLIAISLLGACASSAQPQVAETVQPNSSSPTDATIDITTSLPITNSTESIATSQTSPIATASSEGPIEPEPEANNQVEDDGRQAVFPNTVIVYQKNSGDSQQQWTIYHTGRIVAGDGSEWQIQADQLKPLFDLVEASDFWALDDKGEPNVECLDCEAQIVTVYYEGDVKEITTLDTSAELSQSLKNVLDILDGLSSQQ